MYIFLDESGDLGFDFYNKNPSLYFCVSVLVCVSRADLFSFQAAVRRTLRTKFNSKNKKNPINELKGINATTEVKRFFYRQVEKRKNMGWEIHSVVVDKQRLASLGLSKLNSNRLYNDLACDLVSKVSFANLQSNVYLVVDKSKSVYERRVFDQKLHQDIVPLLPRGCDLFIQHESSASSAGLQAVDLFCHGVVRKHAVADFSWYDCFADKVLTEIEWPECR